MNHRYISTKLFLILAVAVFAFTACNKDEGPFELATSVQDTSTVLFSADIQSIFNSNCIACHNQLHAKLNLLSCCAYDQLLATGFNAPYIDINSPENSRLYKHVSGQLSVMPPSGQMSDAEINKILNWIKQGGKNN